MSTVSDKIRREVYLKEKPEIVDRMLARGKLSNEESAESEGTFLDFVLVCAGMKTL